MPPLSTEALLHLTLSRQSLPGKSEVPPTRWETRSGLSTMLAMLRVAPIE